MKELHFKYKRDTGDPVPDFDNEQQEYVDWLEEFAEKQIKFEKFMEGFNEKLKDEKNKT